MSVSTITWSPTALWGVGSGGVWLELTPNDVTGDVTLEGSDEAGVIFDATTDQTFRFATVAGDQRMLDGPILLAGDLRFFARRVVGSNPPWTVEVGLVSDPQPVDFSAPDELPWERGEVSLGIFTLADVPVAPDATQYTLTLPAVDLRALVTSRARWNGRLALSLRAFSFANRVRVMNGPSFPVEMVTSQESLWFSGLVGGPSGHVRAVRDGRYGMPAFSTELVRDGDDPGLFVRPFDSDPEDEEQTYRPRPGEGSVDDQIPDL